MNAGIDVHQIQRFGALYIAAARLKSLSKWKVAVAAVDIGNPFFYLMWLINNLMLTLSIPDYLGRKVAAWMTEDFDSLRSAL